MVFKLKHLFFVMILVLSGFTWAQSSCPKGTFQELKDLSDKMDPIISASATENIPQFCQLNGIRDRQETFIPDNHITTAGWMDNFVATKDFREISFLAHSEIDVSDDLLLKPRPLSDNERQNLYGKLLSKLNQQQVESSNIAKQDSESVQVFWGHSPLDQTGGISAGAAKSYFLCKDLTVAHIKTCSNGINKMIQMESPEEAIVLPSVWKAVASDPDYLKVFKKVSLKIVSSLQANRAPSSTLMDDLKAEFFTISGDKKKAADKAWNTMALLASGGGNTDKRARSLGLGDGLGDTYATFINVLTNGSIALDRLSAEKGFLYTYPKEVNNLCDYGKNYHFWMTAYLAREYKKESDDAVGSAAAAYSVEKGYQFAKVAGGRDPTKPFKDALYSNYNNNIRLDLSLAAAGAWYGAVDDKDNLHISQKQVDDTIRGTFVNSKALTQPIQVSPDDFENGNAMKTLSLYSKWKQVINPDQAFETFQKLTGN